MSVPDTVIFFLGGVAANLLHDRYPDLEFRTFSHPSMRGYPGFLAGFAQLDLKYGALAHGVEICDIHLISEHYL